MAPTAFKFKTSPIGQVPEEWEVKNIGQIAVPISEKNFKNKTLPVLSCTKYIGLVDSLDYFKGRQIFSEKLNTYKVVKRNQFAYATNHIEEGSIGLQNLYDYALVSPMYTVFETNDSINTEWLFFLLKSKKYVEFYKSKTEATVNRRGSLRWGGFSQISIAVPHRTEQQEIAALLNKINKAIEETNQLINKYLGIKQGLMQDLFKYGIDENGNVRSEKTHKFKDSPLGKIPEGWDVKSLLEGIGNRNNQIVAGPFGSNLKVSDYKNEGVPILRLQNIDTNRFLDKDIKYITLKKAKELEYHSFAGGDIVLAKLGDPVGKTCVIPNHFKFGIVVSDVVRIRVNEKIVDKYFLVELLNLPLSRNQLYLDVIGTTRPRVNLNQIRNLQLLFPNIDEQVRIVSILRNSNMLIEKEELYMHKLLSVKQGLMQDLLTGKVRVNKLIN